MFSNSFKKKIIQKYNISESIINRPIHYRIPDLVNIKLSSEPLYYSLKKVNNSNDIETHKINSKSPLTSTQRNYKKTILRKETFKKKLQLLINDENPINIFNKNQNKAIKMIYELKKYQNITNKAVINNFINSKNHKKSTIFPNVFQNKKRNQKLTKINKMMPPNFFFTPQMTKIKMKNRYRIRNLKFFSPKENETCNDGIKQLKKKEKSIDSDRCCIKIIKTQNNTNNDLIIRKDSIKKEHNDDNKTYSYDDSPYRIKSRYFNTNIINDNNNFGN